MATYRGMDGSLALATTAVGEVFGWAATINGETLEDTVFGDNWVTMKGGLASWSATCNARFDYGDTNGQKVLTDLLLAATPAFNAADVRFRIDGTTKYLSGAGLVSSIAITQQLRNIVEATFTITGNGPITPTWS